MKRDALILGGMAAAMIGTGVFMQAGYDRQRNISVGLGPDMGRKVSSGGQREAAGRSIASLGGVMMGDSTPSGRRVLNSSESPNSSINLPETPDSSPNSQMIFDTSPANWQVEDDADDRSTVGEPVDFPPDGNGGWIILQNMPGWKSEQHRIRCTIHGGTRLPMGGSYGPIPAIRNGYGVDERDIHACYWLYDGSIHAIDPDTDEDGVLWWPNYVSDIDPWSGRIRVEWVADPWVQARLDAHPNWPADYEGPKWRTTFMYVPEAARPADFNGDGLVDTKDFTAYLNAWNAARENQQ